MGYDSWHELVVREFQLDREVAALPLALTANAVGKIFAGELTTAAGVITVRRKYVWGREKDRKATRCAGYRSMPRRSS